MQLFISRRLTVNAAEYQRCRFDLDAMTVNMLTTDAATVVSVIEAHVTQGHNTTRKGKIHAKQYQTFYWYIPRNTCVAYG
jgi:hypothetical protein